MTDEWYYSRDGETQLGPISSGKLRQLARTGGLNPKDLVVRPGMKNWVPAKQIGGLFPAQDFGSGSAQSRQAHAPGQATEEPPNLGYAGVRVQAVDNKVRSKRPSITAIALPVLLVFALGGVTAYWIVTRRSDPAARQASLPGTEQPPSVAEKRQPRGAEKTGAEQTAAQNEIGGKSRPRRVQIDQDEEAIRSAVPLQAPSLAESSKLREFNYQLRALASSQETFQKNEQKVFVSTFNQKDVKQFGPSVTSPTGFETKRNVIQELGTVDPDNGSYSIGLYFWLHLDRHVPFGQDVLAAQLHHVDRCALSARFPLDRKTADEWNALIGRGRLGLTVWYRFQEVRSYSFVDEDQNGHGIPKHDISFKIHVLKVVGHESTGNEVVAYSGLPQLTRLSRRRQLLQDLNEKWVKLLISEGKAETAQVEAKKRQLDQEYQLFQLDPRSGDLFNSNTVERLNDFLRRYGELQRELEQMKQKDQGRAEEAEQERRRILKDNPEPGDPQYQEYNGRLLTASELRKVKADEAEKARFAKLHESPKAAAEDKMNQTFGERSDYKVTFLSTKKSKTDDGLATIKYRVSKFVKGKITGTRNIEVFVSRNEDGLWIVQSLQ